jgi:hypothetical protein
MGYQFQISAKILSWPRQCACCGESADNHFRAAASRTTGTRVKKTTTSWWEVPYCSECLAHKAKFESANIWLIAGLILGLLAWFFVGSGTDSGIAGFFVGALLVGGSFSPYSQAKKAAETMMKQSCCSPGAAVQYVQWHGTMHTFIFESKPYLDSFLASNAKKTMSNVSQV